MNESHNRYLPLPTHHQPTLVLKQHLWVCGLACQFTDSPWFDSEDLHQDLSVYPRISQAAPLDQCASVKPPAS